MQRTILRAPLLLLLVLLPLPLSLVAASPALAPGDLDTTFGTGGKVVTDFGGANDTGLSMGIQSDGKIVVAGWSNAGGTNDFILARYNASGSLDTTFGSGGKVTTGFGGDDRGYSLAIQGDGKIVVAGRSNAGGTNDFVLARYNANGSLDTTFGAGGKVTTGFGGDDRGYSLAIQGDGRILVAGEGGVAADFPLARYNADGSLDTTFGAGGKVTTDFGGDDVAYSVAIQGDGRILVAGCSNVSGNYDFALARYNADGSLDTTFGAVGKVTTNFGANDCGYSVAIQGDGKIVLVGYAQTGGWGNFGLARYNADGILDTTFGAGGKVITDFGGDDTGRSMAIQGDGKIVVAGLAQTGGAHDFALARYSANGSLDATFGTGGTVTTNFGGSDSAYSMAIQGDGKIVVAGGTNGNVALARYLDGAAASQTPTPAPPTPTPTLVPGVGVAGLLVLAFGLVGLALLFATRRASSKVG